MMSDLAEIAAAAGIAIIDSDAAVGKDEEETDNKHASDQISEWDVIFSGRYTESDPEYAETVEKYELLNQPPCVTNFNCWRNRGDSRNWNRDRRRYNGDRGRYNNRGDQHDRWNSPSGDRGGNWGREGRQQQGLQNYGDYHRGYGDQHRPRDNDRQSWGNDSYQNRSSGHYQNRGSHGSNNSRNDSGDSQNMRHNQRQRDGGRGDNRERSPQR